MRLAKYLAGAGVASRRKAEEIIQAGRVRVNGEVTLLPQTQVAESDNVTLDGVGIKEAEKKIYILLDKPAGYISTVTDTHGRPTVLELVKNIPCRLYPVGRLDVDTSGVLLLTNDGELANRLTHPRYGVEKVYRAWVKGYPNEDALAKLAGGVQIEGGKTAPAEVRKIRVSREKEMTLLEITLREGRKRQVKLMCAAVGHSVRKLRRFRFAFLTARGMRLGEFRKLTPSEVKRLYQMTEVKE